MQNKNMREEALRYHAEGQSGKIAVVPTKPLASQHDFSLAYSPGVAEPCLEIVKNPLDAYKYTGKGNLVAVITNGTAVLGLGNIGALAGKPVMEGKSMLFKVFADIDAFDIEVDATDTDRFVETVKAIAPTFGGINLEDIKAPECFEIEARLREELDIPVMHDDQHGTAIISGAALLNGLEIAGKSIADARVVISSGYPDARNGPHDGPRSAGAGLGQPHAGDHLRRGDGIPSGHHLRNGPFGLSQSGKQRARFPVPFPGCARCICQYDQ